MRKLESQKISKLLKNKRLLSGQVMDHVQKLQKMDKILSKILPSPLNQHCRTANLREKTIVLATDSPSWKSNLRFLAPTLLRELNQQLPVTLEKIEILVESRHSTKKPVNRRKAQLSKKSAELIRSTADSMDDPQLKKALLDLSRRKKSTLSGVD
jgi:hypothetical protein